jgi:hypothetical protein
MTISIDTLVTSSPAADRSRRVAIKLFAIFVWAALIIFFSLRAVPTSLDDSNYMNYFTGTGVEYNTATGTFGRLYSYATQEPIWKTYSYFIGRIFSPENSVRVTIAISLLLLAIAAFLAGRPILFLAMYAVTPELLFNINYTQIRQGLALAVFLVVAKLSRSIKIGALFACLIHSSFILLLLAAFIREAKTRTHAVIAIFVSAIGGLLLLSQIGIAGLLGRRNHYVTLVDSRNLMFWIVSIAIVIIVFFLARWYSRVGNVAQSRAKVLDISVLNTVGALLISIFVAPIAGRFIINSDALQIYALSDPKAFRRGPFWLFVFGWILFQTYELYGSVQHGTDFFVSFRSLF